VERRRQYDELIREVDGAQSASGAAAGQLAIDVSPNSNDEGMLNANGSKSSEEEAAEKSKLFDAEFHDYLLMQRCYLGCSAVFFKHGFAIPFTGVTLREGLAENFLLYLMNNHSIVSCVYACKQSSHSRNGRRWVLIVQHAVGFFITNIAGVLFLAAGVGGVYSQATAEPTTSYFACQLFDIFVTAPIAITLGEGFRRLYRCDVSVSTIEKYPRYIRALTVIRKWLVIPLIILGVLGLLVICAVLLFEVFVDAFLGFRQAETEKVEEGADPDVPTLNALGIGYTQSLGAAPLISLHLPSSPLISLHPAYTTSLGNTWREGHTSGDHDHTSGDHDHTADARPTLIGDPPADPNRGPSDDSSRAPLSPVVHTAAVAHRDSL
jgi:hypothetical protein